jgi:hypothetical protein
MPLSGAYTADQLAARVAKAEIENEHLRGIVRAASKRLFEICDGSNWPEYAQTGDGYKAYGEITEQLHEIADDLSAPNA